MSANWIETSRRCSRCRLVKPVTEFYASEKRKFYRCIPCEKAHRNAYYSKNKVAIKRRIRSYRDKDPEGVRKKDREAYRRNPDRFLRHWLKKSYGITLEKYREMIFLQSGQCGLCSDLGQKLYLDHCHETGKLRKLLCRRCNTGLGNFRDSPDLLQRAINYL